MNTKTLSMYLPFAALTLALVGVSLYFSVRSPEEFVGWLGVENSYVLLFVLAFVSGILTFSGVPYHLMLIALALGGLDPWFLGASAASGVILGDCTSYLVGYYGRAIVPERMLSLVQKVPIFLDRHPRLTPLFFFVYGSIAPFSNDLVGVTMGVARYPIARVMIPLGLGNLVFNTALAIFAAQVYALLARTLS